MVARSLLISLILFFSLCPNHASAQIEIKTSPIGLLLSSPNIYADYVISNEISVELTLGANFGQSVFSTRFNNPNKQSGYRVRLNGKYYFNSEDGADGWYTGIYFGPESRSVTYERTINGIDQGFKLFRFNAGFNAGFKWVGISGIVFELGLGLGRSFIKNISDSRFGSFGIFSESDITGFGRAALGYRF